MTTLEPQFDSVFGVSAYFNTYPRFVVGIKKRFGKMQFGVIDATGKWLLQPEYEAIHLGLESGYCFNRFFVERDNRYQLISSDFEPETGIWYDEIIPNSTTFRSYSLRKGNEYTYDNGNPSNRITFPYPARSITTFDDYQVWLLYNRDGDFLGYADRKGHLFFSK